MAYYKKRRYGLKRRTYRKRMYRKRKVAFSKKRRTFNKVKAITGFPDAMMTKLNYVTYDTLSGTSGVIDYNTYAGNSVYDPDVTGGGHQPNAFDEYATLYYKYRVHGCKITVTGSNLVDTVTTVMGLQASTTNTYPAGYPEALEQPRTISAIIAGKEGQGNVKKLKMYMSTKTMFGEKNINDEDYSAAVTTNPSKLFYFKLFAQASNIASTWQIQANVKLTYYVEFFDRKLLAAS